MKIETQKDKELIALGYILETKISIDRTLFKDPEIINFFKWYDYGIDKIPASKKDVLTKFVNYVNIQYASFKNTHTNYEEEIKQILEELNKNTTYYNCVFTDLFDDRLAIKVEEYFVSTGIAQFDKYLTGGLQKQTLTGIQAATGRGKTTMLLTIGTNMLKQGYNVAFINLEMNNTEFNNNILSGISDKYSYSDIKTNNNIGNPEFRKSLIEEIKSKKIGKHALIHNQEYDNMNTVELEKIIKQTEEKLQIKFDAILIDYLFLVKPFINGYKNEQGYEKLQRITQEGHKMAQRNNWAVLSVFQENRQGYKNTNTAGAGDMAGSFNALHDMDNYFKFYQDTDRDLIIIRPEKLRQYGSFNPNKEQFAMEYSIAKKTYIPTNTSARELKDYNWEEIYDLKEVHENLCPKDFKSLLESLEIKVPSDKSISIRKSNKAYVTPYGKSKVDWQQLNIENLLRRKQALNNTQTIISAPSPSFTDNVENLFNI